jgi:futalosine hydrolase
MLLVVSATKKELEPLHQFIAAADNLELLVVGMGPVAAAANLSRHLALHGSKIHGVINIGVGGAYVGSGLELLDMCLARQETFGDFGICQQERIQDFDPGLTDLNTPFVFDNDLVTSCKDILNRREVAYKETAFVTVNCCTGSEDRGKYLRQKFKAGCENMEGAAVVMVCNTFNIPCVEIRCISNMVEDRNLDKWQLVQAIERGCDVTRTVLENLTERPHG